MSGLLHLRGHLGTSFAELSSPVWATPCNELLLPAPLEKQTSGSGFKNKLQSTPIATSLKAHGVEILQEVFNRRVWYSELWAGPAYSNSPPPSSLTTPKFSFWGKRAVSLDFPNSSIVSDGFAVHSTAKSAPVSPTTVDCRQSSKVLFNIADSAMQTPHRILNLDNSDD